MSFLDDIVSVGKDIFGGNDIGSMLARTAALGGVMYLVNGMGKSSATPNTATPGQAATVAPTSRVTLNPDPQTKIPVIYGTTHAPGILTDAQISTDQKTMYYVYTISEQTGTLLSDGSQSQFTFQDVYIDDKRVTFEDDGLTVAYTTDADGNVDKSMQDLVKVYCYAGNSTWPQVIDGYTNTSLPFAYNVVPNWDSTYLMQNLVFAVVAMTYNSANNITKSPSNLKFHVTNTMNQPGDCLYDYMTNNIYGAGIPAGSIRL